MEEEARELIDRWEGWRYYHRQRGRRPLTIRRRQYRFSATPRPIATRWRLTERRALWYSLLIVTAIALMFYFLG